MPKLNPEYEKRALARLKAMMRDPRYWQTEDPAYINTVQQGFENLYDNPPPEALAREGEAANELGLNGPHHRQDSDLAHLTPGEIVVPRSAQTVEVLNALYAAMGDRMAHYVVGGGYEQRNPTSGLPAFADTKGWFHNATRWHFEQRDDLNRPLPRNEEEAQKGQWIRMPNTKNLFHDNRDNYPEKKYIHRDGREVIFDGNTGQVVRDPRLKGTFNYIQSTGAPKDNADIVGWAKHIGKSFGHFAADMVPYGFGGNVRGPEPKPYRTRPVFGAPHRRVK